MIEVPGTPRPGESARDYLARYSAEECSRALSFEEARSRLVESFHTWWPLSWLRRLIALGEFYRYDCIIRSIREDADRCAMVVDLIDRQKTTRACYQLGCWIDELDREIENLRDEHDGQGRRINARRLKADALAKIRECFYSTFAELRENLNTVA